MGKAYLSDDGIGVKLKKAYVVEVGKTVKLKKGYDVEDSKTVKTWSGGELVYYGTLVDVAVYSESNQSGGSNDNYAMISGGRVSAGVPVYAYDKSLTLNTSAKLSTARNKMPCATVGEYVLFGGGFYSSTSSPTVVDAFNNSLTRINPEEMTACAYNGSHSKSGTGVGDYVIFDATYLSNKNVYNKSLTKSILAFESGDACFNCGSVYDYAIFVGGHKNNENLASGRAYDKSLTKIKIDPFTTYKYGTAVANVGGHVLFVAGRSRGSGYLATVEAYDNSLTHTVLSNLDVARWYVTGASVEGYAIFAGGYNSSVYGSNNSTDLVEVYDESLTRTIAPAPLCQARDRMVGVSIGNYAIFASGQYGTQDLGTVDVYEVS